MKSVCAKIFSDTLPGSRLTLCVKGVKRWISRSCATGEWNFEHCEAFLTPLGGIAVALYHQTGTLIRLRDAISAAHSLLLEPSGCPSETDARLPELLHDESWPMCGCLSTVRLSWHHSGVLLPSRIGRSPTGPTQPTP